MADPQVLTDAQHRESVDPEERIRPMPLLPALIAVGMVLFGIVYIMQSDLSSKPWMGDQRTLADLQAKPAGGSTAGGGGAVDGGALYAAHCAACHQATGAGLPGVFPPLDGSEWVAGSPKILANILLHGINGEITVKGTRYKGLMPPFAQLSDAELAGLATHIRSTWSNQAEALVVDLFAQERKTERAPFEDEASLKALDP